MANDIDIFWEIFKSVSGEEGNITTVLDAIAKSDRTKIESYFTSVIDQQSYSSVDYNRFRKFLIDIFATHRALATSSMKASDVRSLSNSNLDELFRSFGYPYSSQLKGISKDPAEQKIQFFLDLVNLYKVKGTPQSLVDALHYYGVTNLDIFEFSLQFEETNDNLIFYGKSVAGTSLSVTDLKMPFNSITSTDPHWLYTKDQILELNEINKIRLPSKTPYIAVQPNIDLVGPEVSIISRLVQDQLNTWFETSIVPTSNAFISIVGETVSFLELYLSTVYIYNKIFPVGSYSYLFNCYDGIKTNHVDITKDFNDLMTGPFTRDSLRENREAYLNLFSRRSESNHLMNKYSAGYILNAISPSLVESLDELPVESAILYSFLKDLSSWVRLNIGHGFINFGFILFGVNEFFNDLKPVIEFFKPYRARLLLIEAFQSRNRLFNSVIVEDYFHLDINITNVDFITANSTFCCGAGDPYPCDETVPECKRTFVIDPPSEYVNKGIWAPSVLYSINDVVLASEDGKQYICILSHSSESDIKPPHGAEWQIAWQLLSEIICTEDAHPVSYYSRHTLDCQSYFDIGACSDIPIPPELNFVDNYYDYLRCSRDDGTGHVSYSLIYESYVPIYILPIAENSISKIVRFNVPAPNTDYVVGVSLNGVLSNIDIVSYMVTQKNRTSFLITYSAPLPSIYYNLEWYISTNSNRSGIIPLTIGQRTITVTLPSAKSNNEYIISAVISNVVDTNPDIFLYTITEKTTTNFTLLFSGDITSNNYKLEWMTPDSKQNGIEEIPYGSTSVTIPYTETTEDINTFPLLININFHQNDPQEIIAFYPYLVTHRTLTEFTVEFTGPVNSNNYTLMWSLYSGEEYDLEEFEYYQTGGFNVLDSGGVFDCMFGSDHIYVVAENAIDFLLQENEFFLLQENGFRIIL